jgi:hypothetical protein
MLKSKRAKDFVGYTVTFEGATYDIYKDPDGWVAESSGRLVTESDTKVDLLDKLEDILRFGN